MWYAFFSIGAVSMDGLPNGRRRVAASVPINRVGTFPAYLLAKLEVKARHHFLLPRCAILDVRIFSYADIAISLES